MFIQDKKKKRKNLDSVLFIAQSIIDKSEVSDDFIQPIYSYIKAIGSTVQQRLLMHLITGQEVTQVEELFIDLGRDIKGENNEYIYAPSSIEDNEKISISLKDNLVIPVAWNMSRFVDNITGIGTECGNSFTFQKLNHRSILYLPIGVTIVYNGNHSILTGIIKSEGIIHPTEIIDLAPLFEKVKFDGTYYRDIKSNKIVQTVRNFELGAIFEIGRLLAKAHISFLN